VRSKLTKSALAVSIFLLVMWCVFGTGTSLAWFSDSELDARNSFIIGEAKLTVSYYQQKENGNFEFVEIEDDTDTIFDDEALYEPGYTQVVYLEMKNDGSIPVELILALTENSYTDGENVFGDTMHLSDYLLFDTVTDDDGVFFDSLGDLQEYIEDRTAAQGLASLALSSLNDYSKNGGTVEAGETKYTALVLYMPESTANVANYRGDSIPKIELGITVTAVQEGAADKIQN